MKVIKSLFFRQYPEKRQEGKSLSYSKHENCNYTAKYRQISYNFMPLIFGRMDLMPAIPVNLENYFGAIWITDQKFIENLPVTRSVINPLMHNVPKWSATP